ncbi:MAG: putative aconitase with swiveling domain [Nitriliruptoraceae bacterium]|jgi:predicted aconitase with swiveling domain
MTVIEGRTLTPGTVTAPVLVLDEPLSFWGGMDPHDGRIIDRNHPQHGLSLTGMMVVMAAGRGSSSSSSVLAEAIRLGTAPAALVLGEPDAIVALGALAASELYGVALPVVSTASWRALMTGQTATVHGTRCGGPMTITPGPVG